MWLHRKRSVSAVRHEDLVLRGRKEGWEARQRGGEGDNDVDCSSTDVGRSKEAKTEIDGDVTDGELTAAKQDLKAREMRTRGRIRTSRRERERTSTRM